jgi:hypothetical protein
MEDSPYLCSFHPREPVVGVCAHCLKDSLLAVVSRDSAGGGLLPPRRRRTSSISLPKVFALGSSFLLLQRHQHQRHYHADEEEEAYSVASLDGKSSLLSVWQYIR